MNLRPVAIFTSVLVVLPLLFFAIDSAHPRKVLSAGKAFGAETHSQCTDNAFRRIWHRKNNQHAHYVRERNEKISKVNFSNVGPTVAYDYFEPEWNCEDEVRLGSEIVSSGDGPKFVCGSDVLASTEDCIVYSIGSNYDFSFEYAVNRIAPQCEIHTFDGTLDLTQRALPGGLKERNIYFHHWNIVSGCHPEEMAKLKYPSRCVSESLQQLNHDKNTTISWLKIDCEGCEFTVTPKFFESSVEIHQIMMEVHGTNATKVKNLFTSLHKAGMIIFHKERNHWGCAGYKCVEFSLISSSYAQRVLQTFLTR